MGLEKRLTVQGADRSVGVHTSGLLNVQEDDVGTSVWRDGAGVSAALMIVQVAPEEWSAWVQWYK